MADDTERRLTFDGVAALYDKVRPHYPPALFDRLVDVTGLPAHASVLEIGPGTGQATEPLARRGYEVVAVEIGPNLAAIARQVLHAYPNVTVLTGSFEDTDLPESAFDLVLAATAFHWVNEDARFAKPHRLLRSRGHLAIVHTEHVSDERGDAFVHASQPIYERHWPSSPGEEFRLPKAADLQPLPVDEQLFEPVCFDVFPLIIRYRADDYVDLLNTSSPTRAMPSPDRSAFLQDIRSLIDSTFGGVVEKHVTMTLDVAQKRER